MSSEKYRRKTFKKRLKKSIKKTFIKKKYSKRRKSRKIRKRTLNKKKLKGGTFLKSPLIKSLEKTYQFLENNKLMYNKGNFIETTLQDIYNLIREEYNTNNLSFKDCEEGKCCINPTKGVVANISKYEDCVKEMVPQKWGGPAIPSNKWIGPISTTPYTFDKGYSNITGLTIIPSVLSRLGEEDIFKIDQPLNKVIQNIINWYVQLLYYLEDIHGYILPSSYDSFFIDSKIHYMDVLLHHNLCDPDTIVLYYDLENEKEDISLRSEKTIQNIQKMQNLTEKKEINSFFTKTAFGGSTKCVINQKDLSALNLFKNTTNIYKHILPYFDGKGCIGKYYGVIIQPENLHFNVENSSHGEIRCFCHKGDIKSIIIKTQGQYNIHGYPFWMISLHKSVLIKKKELYLKDLDNETFNQQLISMNKNLTEFTAQLNIICDSIIDKLPEFILSEPKYSEIYISNIIDLCKSTYNIIKKDLEIDGIHHRIDIINSRADKQKYVVNEIENINFGELSNEISKSASILMNYVNTIKEYRGFLDPKNNTEELLQLKEDITKIIPVDYSFKSLTFDMKFSPPLYPDEFEEKLRKNGFGKRGDKGFVDDVFKRIHEHFSSKGEKISYKDYRNFFFDTDLSKLTFDESNIEGLLCKHLQNIFNNWDKWDNRKILLSFE